MPERICIKYIGPTPLKVDATTITAGSVNTATAAFEFDSAWDEFKKTAIFKSDKFVVSVILDETNTCAIPWEVLIEPGFFNVGVIGTAGTKTLPTGEVMIPIVEGTGGETSEPKEPTPSVVEQIYQKAVDAENAAKTAKDAAAKAERTLENAVVPEDGYGFSNIKRFVCLSWPHAPHEYTLVLYGQDDKQLAHISLYDSYITDKTVEDLDKKVSALEKRIALLESEVLPVVVDKEKMSITTKAYPVGRLLTSYNADNCTWTIWAGGAVQTADNTVIILTSLNVPVAKHYVRIGLEGTDDFAEAYDVNVVSTINGGESTNRWWGKQIVYNGDIVFNVHDATGSEKGKYAFEDLTNKNDVLQEVWLKPQAVGGGWGDTLSGDLKIKYIAFFDNEADARNYVYGA